MNKESGHSGFGGRQYRKRAIYHNIALISFLVVLLSLIPIVIINLRGRNVTNRRDLSQLWESLSFEEVYQLSKEQLSQKPMDFFLLTIHGFSSYELAIAQINNLSMLGYINNCIWSLRKAMLLEEGVNDGRLFYVLGKAYYYKGTGYEDLAIKYLERARDFGFDVKDIPEYLGLAYASVRDYTKSVAAFTTVINPTGIGQPAPSDILLLSIANSYIALGEDEAARTFLSQCLETTMDSNMVSAARLNLAGILFRAGDLTGAEELYNQIIEAGGNADAYFQLGELYSAKGESSRALAQWRRAIQIDPGHGLARSRLNL